MSNLAATDITYTVVQERRVRGQVHALVKLVFGDAALTYPAGGVPITKAKLGCPTIIESLAIFDSGTSGYRWSYDRTNEKLVAMQSGAISAHTHTGPAHTHTVAHAHDLLLKNAAVADGASARVNAGANLLGANTGGDLTVTGAGANGGVQTTTPTSSSSGTGATSSDGATAAAAMAEPSTVAIAAQTLYAEVIGW